MGQIVSMYRGLVHPSTKVRAEQFKLRLQGFYQKLMKALTTTGLHQASTTPLHFFLGTEGGLGSKGFAI